MLIFNPRGPLVLGSHKTVMSKLGILATGVTVASLAVGCQAPPVAPKFDFGASAFGSTAAVTTDVNSAPTFPAGIGCTTTPGLVVTNSADSTKLSGLGQTGAISSRATTTGGSTVASHAYEQVAGVNLLGGLVSAGAIHLASVTSHNSLGFHTSAAATFAGLKVNGVPISATPRPNTVLSLPGLGSVTVNEQGRRIGIGDAGQTTQGIHIRITVSNSLHLPVGADVVVGQATSGLAGPVGGLVDGQAYGTSAAVTGAGAGTSTGPSALTIMPCRGTNGATISRSTAAATLAGGSSAGATTQTARGIVSRTASSSEMTSTVAGANLLSSLVTAGVIKADAHAGLARTSKVFSDSGSQLTNVKIRGYGGDLAKVAANTKIAIPGVGILYLHRVIRTPNSVEVRMIELVVTVGGNSLPVGADVKVAVAEASVH